MVDNRQYATNHCLLCGKPRLQNGKQAWQSKLRIEVNPYATFTFTICPQCRAEKRIADIFAKMQDTLKPSWEKYGQNIKM